MAIVLGIDGGGTGTQAVVADDHGTVYAEVTVGPTNPNAVSREQLKATASHMFNQLKEQNGEAFDQVELVFAGMSGSGDSEKSKLVESVFAECLPNRRVIVANDAINALYAGTYGEPGIVQIAGTGSITYGINEEGEASRIGGWGYLFGDEGSGYAIGEAALRKVFHTHDRKTDAYNLVDKVSAYFQVDVVPDLVPAVYESISPREKIASLSRVVFEAYDEKDPHATQIVEQAADDLARSINTMLNEHFQQHQTVILAGGLFKREDVLPELLKSRIPSSSQLKLLKREPVMGAVDAALKQLGRA
ncbi:N-acetylglucosamine kinase [Alkalibacillus haloalkaliphilus]|uniref:N-acetylglucosamine kinase n=1 Tax=Alkalibacillus haloalkaliphilus TaxID=94136 RepID=UPI0029365F90|nr:BadF/BadG/BcrA/BcrD ATPase family protein [Alkalibacillus haloalkaliphilus]MDV2582248.1 BadF/BadG/BcrA/BcrD ATPase family protein [Alkalibacillus haloalkaliphilus]